MKHIAEKVRDGVLNLSDVPSETLMAWLQNASEEGKNAIICELFYR